MYLFVWNIFYEQIWQIKLSILFCNCDSIKCDECDTFIRNKTSPSQFIGTFSITFHEAPIEKRVDILFSYVLFQGPWEDHTMIWEREDPPLEGEGPPLLVPRVAFVIKSILVLKTGLYKSHILDWSWLLIHIISSSVTKRPYSLKNNVK